MGGMPSDIFKDEDDDLDEEPEAVDAGEARAARVVELEQRVFELHGRPDSHERGVQYEIVCVQVELCDVRALGARTQEERESINRDRHKFAEQQRQLLKMKSKDRYLTIIRTMEQIERAGSALATLSGMQG